MESGTGASRDQAYPSISAEDILESITDVFAALDAGWRLTYLNAAAERLLRRSRAELLGQELWAVYPILKGTPIDIESRCALAEGVPRIFEHDFGGRCFEFRAFPARAGGVHIYARELTEEKLAKADAERQLAELENIYHTAPIGMAFVDTDLRYLRINERLAAINGLPPSEHIGRTIWEMVPGIADTVAPDHLQVIATGEPIIDREVRGTTRADPHAEHTFLCNYHPVKDQQNKVIGITAIVTDVTDQKRVEQDLRLAAQRFAVALKSSSIAVFNQDRDLRYTWLWNEHSPHYQAAILGKTDLEIKSCKACEDLTEVKRQVLESGAGQRHEFTLPLFGSEQVYDMTLEPLRDERGAVIGITGAAVNITARKSTERALVASEERFRRIVHTAAEGIMIQDAEGRFTFVNRRLADLLGYRVEELMGKPSFDLLHEQDLERGKRSFETRKTGDTSPRDFRFRRRNGDVVWVSIAGNILHGDRGEFLGVLGMVTDITARKRAEINLRENEALMRLALDAGHMGVWDWNVVTGENRWSDWHFAALGFKPGSFKPDYQRFKECIHPDDLPAVERELEDSRTERRIYHIEYRVIWPNRSAHWIEAWGQYFYDSAGEAVRMRGVLVDITERKLAEEALRHRQKLEGVGLLAGGIAHDFNNLLAAILGGASYALDVLPEGHPATPMLKVVEQASERAALLTRQLLAYSGRGQFVLESLDLAALARETCELIRASIPKSVTVSEESETGLPAVVGDAGQMQQLIMNLLINAGEAIGDKENGLVLVHTGCVEVSAARIQTHFRAYDISPGRYVMLEVTDNGSGMDTAMLSRIFDPFFTTKFTGRGLGLAAAQGIVRGHHGAMEVESVVGRGTTFRILLPAAAEGMDARAGVEQPPASVAYHGTVLVIDDEEIVRRTVVASLERAGFTVLQAPSGVDAIRVFSERFQDISLVLLDMSMPGMGGVEVLRNLRTWLPEFPVLVYSGFSEGEVRGKFEGLSVSGVLQKPFTAKELMRHVQRILALP
jgi:PAS domain S-box-containing protein